MNPAERPAHVRSRFEFTVGATLRAVAPLFGGYGERAWVEGWEPRFLHPEPPADEAGAVFALARGGHESTWITTVFDTARGHMQHVAFVPGVMVTLVEIRLAEGEPGRTTVVVTYERTALSPEKNQHVMAMGKADQGSADAWRTAIETCLGVPPGPRDGSHA